MFFLPGVIDNRRKSNNGINQQEFGFQLIFFILIFSLTLVFRFNLFLFCSDQLLPVTDAVDI